MNRTMGLARTQVRLRSLPAPAAAALAVCALCLHAAFAQGAPAAAPVTGLDHMPTAVLDLEQAAADFTRLGFTIKPGRPHDNGIRNTNIKFPNGGAIELIAVSNPTDALARDYADRLAAHGEGGAWWGLYAPDLSALDRALSALGLAPQDAGDMYEDVIEGPSHRMFIGMRGGSPTDGPRYWTHPNTAWRWAAVWLADAPEDAALISALGAPPERGEVCAPFASSADIFVLAEGDQVIVTGPAPGRAPERAILGATILVRDLDTARAVLDGAGAPYEAVPGCGANSIWIAPANAHGLWLELRQQ